MKELSDLNTFISQNITYERRVTGLHLYSLWFTFTYHIVISLALMRLQLE